MGIPDRVERAGNDALVFRNGWQKLDGGAFVPIGFSGLYRRHGRAAVGQNVPLDAVDEGTFAACGPARGLAPRHVVVEFAVYEAVSLHPAGQPLPIWIRSTPTRVPPVVPQELTRFVQFLQTWRLIPKHCTTDNSQPRNRAPRRAERSSLSSRVCGRPFLAWAPGTRSE